MQEEKKTQNHFILMQFFCWVFFVTRDKNKQKKFKKIISRRKKKCSFLLVGYFSWEENEINFF